MSNMQYFAKKLIMFILIVLIAFTSTEAIAGSAPDGTGSEGIPAVNRAICKVIEVLKGPLARGIGTVAIVFLAFGLFAGKMSWGVALSTGIAIAVIFGASDIVELIAGSGNSELDCTPFAN